MRASGTLKHAGQILLIPQESIVPNRSQPRKVFDRDELEGLAQSIRLNGIIQPLNVRMRDDGMYELIAGERRLRAARMAGLSKIPCIVMKVNDEKSAVYALLENLQRQDLNFFEEAEAMARLIRSGNLTQDELALRLGKSQSAVSNKLRLLRLPEEIREEIGNAELTERHARALLRLCGSEKLTVAIKTVVAQKLNVEQTDRLVTQLLQDGRVEKRVPLKLFKDVRLFVNTLNHAIDTMRGAGIQADSRRSETEDYIEYVVRIPKTSVYCVRGKDRGA